MPLVPIGIAWLAGIWAALTFDLSFLIQVGIWRCLLLVVPLAGIVLWRQDPRARLAWIALLATFLGALRGVSVQPVFDADHLATYNDRGVVTVAGVVDDYPDRRDTFVNLRVRAEIVAFSTSDTSGDPSPIEGIVLVRADRLTDYRYGDRLEVTGALQSPPEFATFNYRDYLASKGVHSIIDRPLVELIERDQGSPIFAALFDLKDRARDTLAAILPEPQAALLTGILLGDDAGLPQSVKDDFRITGTSHIVAISGYNFAVLIGLASVPAVRLFGRRRAFPILLIVIVAYTALVGWSGSVVRAAIMGALTLWATYLGRQAAALNSLFVAAMLMTLLDPFTLGDVGFQLSFAATLGLVMYTRPLQDAAEWGMMKVLSAGSAASETSAPGSASVPSAALRGSSRDASYRGGVKKIVGALNDAVLVTLAAQITALPILIVTFRQISILTLIVNALVLPAQTGVMIFGGLALLTGMAFLPLGQIVGGLAWLFLTWTLQVIHLFSSIPGVATELGYVDPLWGVAYVAMLVAMTFWFSRSAEQKKELKELARAKVSVRLAVSAFGILALLGAVALSWQPDGRLHVHALNVDGMPVFVQTPGGRQILIGGSNSPSALLGALGARMPFWDRDLDLLVVPSPDARSLNGLLAVVDRYRVGQIVSVEVKDNRASREWHDVLATKSIEVIEAGSSIGVEEGVTVTLSQGGWVRIDAVGALVGIGAPISGSRADVLIVSEMSAEITEWVGRIAPQIVVAPASLELSESVEGMVFVTTETGAVELTFDGAQWQVQGLP